jgi:hypothetical protein
MSVNVARVVVIGLLAGMMGTGAAFSADKKYVEVRWTDTAIPLIELLQGNTPRVSLPVLLKKAIERKFPSYRVPENQDYEGDWVERYDYLSPEEREKKVPLSTEQLNHRKVPFLALGDFNHDGKRDVAVLLVGKSPMQGWRFVIFHGNLAGYQPIVLDESKGDPRYSPITRYYIQTEHQCRDGRECAVLGVSESAEFQYIWENNRYVEVNIHD